MKNVALFFLVVITFVLAVKLFFMGKTQDELNQELKAKETINHQLSTEVNQLKESANLDSDTIERQQELSEQLPENTVTAQDIDLPIIDLPKVELGQDQKQSKQKDAPLDPVEDLQQFAESMGMRINENGEHPVDEVFENEDVDVAWATDLEAKIQDFVHSDQEFGFDVRELTCKSSRCIVKLATNAKNSMYQVSMFSKNLEAQEWFDEQMNTNMSPDIYSGTSKIVIFRDATSIFKGANKGK